MPKPKAKLKGNKARLPLRHGNKMIGLIQPADCVSSLTALNKSKGVLKARSKHKHDHDLIVNPPTKPTLAQRFFDLPAEIRNHIYALLLVRPSKWDIQHDPRCPHYNWDHSHEIAFDDGCLYCDGNDIHYSTWRNQPYPGVDSPMLSSWAPPRGNIYLCSDCHQSRFRQRPFPSRNDLTCVCPRRENLQLLLVSKRMYHEASHVFWSYNTFAFGHRTVLIRFLITISPESRDKITSISYLASYPETVLDEVDSGNKVCWRVKNRQPWNLLVQCKNLRRLELDAFFLTSCSIVKQLRKLRGLSHVTLSLRERMKPLEELWEELWDDKRDKSGVIAARHVVRGGMAELMARLMKKEQQSAVNDVLKMWHKSTRERTRLLRYAQTWDQTDTGTTDGNSDGEDDGDDY